jgi:hypothetical protein
VDFCVDVVTRQVDRLRALAPGGRAGSEEALA